METIRSPFRMGESNTNTQSVNVNDISIFIFIRSLLHFTDPLIDVRCFAFRFPLFGAYTVGYALHTTNNYYVFCVCNYWIAISRWVALEKAYVHAKTRKQLRSVLIEFWIAKKLCIFIDAANGKIQFHENRIVSEIVNGNEDSIYVEIVPFRFNIELTIYLLC